MPRLRVGQDSVSNGQHRRNLLHAAMLLQSYIPGYEPADNSPDGEDMLGHVPLGIPCPSRFALQLLAKGGMIF